ncbi:hypothetical protein NC653_028483 [Populus alba x Populus x berolinensis]|uniref:Uncharacterized protein n=1 Tax=Populus alba x Populus x berolinensis TaxID=444605 RepID=A0AAD6Q3G0_9ROSI|nr:hypothetical protein NC653_028483 [Populus alba x Populus x berolinensis]
MSIFLGSSSSFLVLGRKNKRKGVSWPIPFKSKYVWGRQLSNLLLGSQLSLTHSQGTICWFGYVSVGKEEEKSNMSLLQTALRRGRPRGAGAGGSPRLKLLEMKKLHWGAAVASSLLCSVRIGGRQSVGNRENAIGSACWINAEVMVHLIQWRAAGFSRRRVEYLLLIVVDREEKVASVGRSWAVVSMEDCWMFTVLWSYVAAHSVEELLGLECWSLTVLVQEEVAPLEEENLHHWILGPKELDGNACDALAVMACGGWRKSAGK